MNLIEQIQEYLRQNPGSYALDIAEDLDADPYEVAEILTRLRDQGQARQEDPNSPTREHPQPDREGSPT